MEKELFQGYNSNERKQMLEDNSHAVEKVGYMKSFTPDEITQFKDDLSVVVIELSGITDRKKEILAGFKEEVKPLAEEQSTLLSNIKNKAEYVDEDCYKIVDQEDGMVGFYNNEGTLVESRPIRQDEKQTTIFQIEKNGTD